MPTYNHQLNECEEWSARWYGERINEDAKANGLHECKVAEGRSGVTIQVEGIGAEWAFAKIHNIFPNTNMEGPNHVDFTMPSGMTVDVKSTDHPRGNLLVPHRFNLDNSADAFALMRGTIKDGFEYVGWVSAIDFFNDANKQRMQPWLPLTWFYSASELNPELMK